MQQYLYKYLLLYQSLTIPALGNFRVVYQPAYINESTGLLFPRKPVIEFSEVADAGSDKSLIGFLAGEMKVDEIVAAKELQNFSIKLLVDMVEQHAAELHGIGKIRKEMNGQVIFYPATNLIDILPPLRMEAKTALEKTTITTVREPIHAPQIAPSAPVSIPLPEVASPVQENKPITSPGTETTQSKPAKAPRELRPDTQKELAELIALKNEASKITAKVVEMKPITPEEEESEKFRLEKWQVYGLALAGAGILAIVIHALIDKPAL